MTELTLPIYYKDGNSGIILCGECANVLGRLQEKTFDLTVTSPPYDDLRDYDKPSFDFEKTATELFRVTKNGGMLVWVVGDACVDGSETGTSFRQALFFREIGFNLHDTMIYAKSGFANPSSNRYHQTFEYMFCLSKGPPKTFNPIMDKPNKWGQQWGKNMKRQKDGRLVERKKSIRTDFGKRYNIWMYDVGGGNSTRDAVAYKHPAIFPESLAEDHILSWSNEGDLVLDPFCGSGTTLKMAKKSNRRYVGIDISKQYCEISRLRVVDIENKSH